MDHKSKSPIVDLLTPEKISELKKILQLRLQGRVRELGLRLREDGLVLEGRAQTYHVKQLAQHALMQAVTVPIRSNDIQVLS